MRYTKEVLAIIRDTRAISLPQYGLAAVAQEKSSPTDVVTELDVKIEHATRERLSTLDSSIEFVGEETGGNRSAERFWLMDPIDGTAHYIRGIPFCTTMLALIEHGEVTFAAIYDFVNDQMYWAEKGRGAYLEETPIQVSNRPLAKSYYSFETNLRKPENLAKFSQLLGQGGCVQLLCSGWELAMVACGKLDGKIHLEPFGKDYDFAPGSLLITEAGGVVRNMSSQSYDYKNYNFIAANPALYHDLTEGTDAAFPIA